MRYLLLTLLTLFTIVPQTYAADLDMSAFKTIPVLHEGRIKPLDTFARLHLNKFAGHEKNAAIWLAETLFDPAEAAEKDLFLVQDKKLKRQLNLESKKKYFSFLELQKALETQQDQVAALMQKEPDDLTSQQNDLLQLQSNVMAFAQIMRSFSLILPLNIELPDEYKTKLKEQELNYLALKPFENEIFERVKSLAQTKGQDLSQYSEEETKLAQLSLSLKLFQLAGENNQSLRIMPGTWSNENAEWFTPWQLILSGEGSPESKRYLDILHEITNAYRNEHPERWREYTQAAFKFVATKTSAAKMKWESLYNAAKPFHLSLILYVTGLVLVIGSLRTDKTLIQNISLTALSSGALIHFIGIIMRIFLLDRPPVGTLYESIIFVSLICAVFGLFMYARSKNLAAVFAGTISTILMLVIAPFMISEGESMEMLVAVLNTNFWLSTHVLCITAGYAVSVFAACLAHVYLWLRYKGTKNAALSNLKSGIYKISIAALLLTAVGTALGGIWADQSWGRFWGWDPKENGALLIVLWLVWLQHGRLAGKLKELSFIAGTAFLNVIVALAWFGVNLLSVGLHSYGFIDGIAYSLGGFFALEVIIIGALWTLIQRQEKTNAA